MNGMQYTFFVLVLIFIQQALYGIKRHVKQCEQYLQWIHEDIQKYVNKTEDQE